VEKEKAKVKEKEKSAKKKKKAKRKECDRRKETVDRHSNSNRMDWYLWTEERSLPMADERLLTKNSESQSRKRVFRASDFDGKIGEMRWQNESRTLAIGSLKS
jgi:hypothetical protein